MFASRCLFRATRKATRSIKRINTNYNCVRSSHVERPKHVKHVPSYLQKNIPTAGGIKGEKQEFITCLKTAEFYEDVFGKHNGCTLEVCSLDPKRDKERERCSSFRKDMKVGDVLHNRKIKVDKILAVPDTCLIMDGIKAMVGASVGALLIYDGDNSNCGVLTERDILQTIATLPDISNLKTLTINNMMMPLMYTPLIDYHDSIWDVLKMMLSPATRRRYFPVVRRHTKSMEPMLSRDMDIVGVVGVSDVLNAVCMDQENNLNFLSDYIQGTYSKMS